MNFSGRLGESKDAQAALARLISRVDLALRGSEIGIFELELSGGLLATSARAIFHNVWEQLGYGFPGAPSSLDETVALSHPDDLDKEQAHLCSYLAGESNTLEFEHRLRHRDGSYRTMLVRGIAVRDGRGVPVRVIGSRVDITNPKQAATLLRASDERFRLASEALAGFIYDWDAATDKIDRYGGVEAVLGLTREEIPAESTWWLDRIHPEDLPAARATARSAMDGEAPGYYVEYRLLHGNGSYVDLSDAARFIRDDGGKVARVVGGIRDVSKRRQLERERVQLLAETDRARLGAERAAKARDDVLGVVSHELRNSLRAIEVCATALLQGDEPRQSATDALLLAIRRSAEVGDRLVSDLLDVAMIESGRMSLVWADVSAAEMIAQTSTIFRPAAEARGLHLVVAAAGDMPLIRADAARLLQALSNLMSNALKFTAPGGSITIGASRTPCGIRFSVEDTGVGIADGDLPFVFDRYWQKASRGRGVGLGLAIVRGIAEAHGGHAQGAGVAGGGCRFTITLPVANAPGVATD